MLVNLFFFTHVAKYLKNYIHNSLYFAKKHGGIFVLGYYLFIRAHSFSHLGSDSVGGQIFVIVFMPNRGCRLYKTNYLQANIFQR